MALEEQAEDWRKDRAARLYQKCQLCGYAVSTKHAVMHKACNMRVRRRMEFNASRGKVMTVAQVIQELHDNGKDLPPS